MRFKGWSELRALVKVQDLVQSIVFYMLASIAMHEGFHQAAMAMFGARGLIELDVHWLIWTGGVTHWAKYLPASAPWYAAPFVYLSGGLLTGLMLLWAYINEDDLEDRLAQLLWGFTNLFYGLVEMTLAWGWIDFYYSWRGVAEALGAALGVWIWMWRDAKIFEKKRGGRGLLGEQGKDDC